MIYRQWLSSPVSIPTSQRFPICLFMSLHRRLCFLLLLFCVCVCVETYFFECRCQFLNRKDTDPVPASFKFEKLDVMYVRKAPWLVAKPSLCHRILNTALFCRFVLPFILIDLVVNNLLSGAVPSPNHWSNIEIFDLCAWKRIIHSMSTGMT